MNKKQINGLLHVITQNILEEELNSKKHSERIRKEIENHNSYMKERRQKFDLIRNK